jgi:hypothetical protein
MPSMPSSRTAKAAQFLRANLLGLVAIFIVLGGTAVALPGKNRIDSGDIKQGQVRTLDLHRSAVTKSKLRRNAVDGTRVRRDSLTGEDVDESTLELALPLKAGSVGEREEADRERRIVIPAGALVPSTPGNPDVALQFGYPAVFYPSAEDRSTGALLEVPLDRATSSGLQLTLLWDAQSTGAVVWRVSARQVGVGTDLGSGVQGGPVVTATVTDPATPIETVALDIPAAALVDGDALALNVTRDADATGDTLPGDAYLRLVEIRYTATG